MKIETTGSYSKSILSLESTLGFQGLKPFKEEINTNEIYSIFCNLDSNT